MRKKKEEEEKVSVLYKECFKKDYKPKKIEPKKFEEKIYTKFENFLISKESKIIENQKKVK